MTDTTSSVSKPETKRWLGRAAGASVLAALGLLGMGEFWDCSSPGAPDLVMEPLPELWAGPDSVVPPRAGAFGRDPSPSWFPAPTRAACPSLPLDTVPPHGHADGDHSVGPSVATTSGSTNVRFADPPRAIRRNSKAQDAADEPLLPSRTVDWTGDSLALRELSRPVALPLDGINYPNRSLVLEVAVGDGACRLVVDAGAVRVNGTWYHAGDSCEVRSGVELSWEGTAGIRLEDPRPEDRIQNPG